MKYPKTKQLRKHRRGCYRMTIDGETFAQLLRGRFEQFRPHGFGGGTIEQFRADTVGHWWMIQIRDIVTGDLLRYAGAYRSLSEAVCEATKINEVD